MSFFTTLLTWTSKKAYLAHYANDESAMKFASNFWNSISSWSWLFLLAMLVIAIGSCLCYYFPFNNKSGRHYMLKYWLISWGISVGIVLIFTLFLSWVLSPSFSFGSSLISRICVINVIYALVAFPFVSFIMEKMCMGYACPLHLIKKNKHK